LPETKKAARELAREVKPEGMTLAVASELVHEAAGIVLARRKVAGWLRRRGVPPSGFYRRSSLCGRPVLLPSGTLQERLARRYSAGVGSAVNYCLRQYARQEASAVSVVDTFGAAGCQLEKENGWIDYKDKHRQGVVSAQYRVQVLRGLLSLPSWLKWCDGLLTLAAVPLPDEAGEGEVVYRAKWARSGQGGVVVEEGVIIRRTVEGRSYTAHGKSVGAARGCITRQLPEYLTAASARERARAERIERVKGRIVAALEAGRLNGFEVEVTLRDSLRAGNCEAGTQHWVESHFPGRSSAMVSEVLAVRDQRERVLLACVAAVRRQRPEVFQVAD
jgi:hypothetical protein